MKIHTLIKYNYSEYFYFRLMSDKMSGIECECNEEHHYDVEESPLREFVKFLYEYFEVADKWIEMQRFAVERPIASVFLIVTLATFAVPVAIFMTFVLGSLIFSCIGFMFFEGMYNMFQSLFNYFKSPYNVMALTYAKS